MYGDDDKSTGSPEKYTKEQFQKMEKERYAEEARQNAERDKAIEKRKTGGGGAMPKSNRDITKNYKKGGMVSSASKRADGCAIKGKTKGRMV